MKLKYFILLMPFLLVLNACKNDLTIVAPYKEIPSVYAIITPQEPMQMIRINKVFLGEGDANVMAKEMDSVNYKAGELSVTLERYVNGGKTIATPTGNKTEITFRDSIIQTVNGAFNTNQRVYVTNDALFSSGEYKLIIKNNTTGNVFTAKTNAIDSMRLTSISPFVLPVYPQPYLSTPPNGYYIDFSNPNGKYIVRTKPASGGFIHDLTIRLHYYDSVAGGKTNHYLDYVFNPQQFKDLVALGATDYFNFTFTGSSLYLEYANMLSKRANPPGFLGRKAYRIDFITYAATSDYYDYLQFAAPSLSFTQEKVLYSNFENRAALGLFTFKSRCLVAKDMAFDFVSQFAYNKHTCPYRFYDAALNIQSCP